jgi:hypothetical protein
VQFPVHFAPLSFDLLIPQTYPEGPETHVLLAVHEQRSHAPPPSTQKIISYLNRFKLSPPLA